MSFLMRRNLPLAWAGWFDDFTSYTTGSIQLPWRHLGDGTTADITEDDTLHIPSNVATVTGGGESYAYQPFTPNWGVELEVYFPVEGLVVQSFAIYFTDSWTTIGGAFQNCVGVRLMNAPLVYSGHVFQLVHFYSMMSADDNLSYWSAPASFFGQWHTVQIWCEDDKWIRIWMNGTYVGSQMIRPAFRLGPGRRCLRFVNAALCDTWIRKLYHYDRPPSIPPKTVWQQDFYDDFNGRSGNQNGVNGWVQYGADAAVVADSWSTTATTEGNWQGLLRDTGNLSGRQRIEATVGGNIGPNNGAASALILATNTAADQGLAANIFGNKLWVSNWSGNIATASFTMMQDLPESFGLTVKSGDRVAFSIYNGIGWIEINDVPQLCVGWMHGVVPAANNYAGLRVGRGSSGNSHSWNDVRIFSGLG
ncbi:hypothetical protein [Nocardia flavorosea]|uniref:Uncharacterized protein n=1 Tax=Nocardia flavorosea TaxID=53429 RepID=A0A846YMS4_9NOCA|nr:hypothetical protein [Nocardia flavorosea]NKY60335.1 hypothetical protein [Nocardia flavorosea]